MLRSILQDSAVAAAKGHSHAQVEPRHVLFAIARHFQERPEVAPLLPAARRALDPRGSADKPPILSPEAVTLLDSATTEQGALAALMGAIKTDQPPPVPPPGPVDSQGSATITAPSDEQPDGHRIATAPEHTAAVLAELEGLIGLGSVKRQVSQIIAVVQANAERAKAGLATVNPGLHLAFTGPPGTGKTTVARLVARLYASTGALPGSNFTEASRFDLVAGYVGQTALKTAELIARTRPGVLFIDEAYALTPRHDSDFGAEAIAALVKAMEDHRNDFAVIVAGYGDEMSHFVGSNPGLRSRLKTYVDFPNYSSGELTRIFERFARESGIGCKEGVLDTVEAVFKKHLEKPDFGNARFARSLFEEAYARMSMRAAVDGKVDVSELQELTPKDVEWQGNQLDRPVRRIGFAGEGPPAAAQ